MIAIYRRSLRTKPDSRRVGLPECARLFAYLEFENDTPHRDRFSLAGGPAHLASGTT